jgi:hypothetical protein
MFAKAGFLLLCSTVAADVNPLRFNEHSLKLAVCATDSATNRFGLYQKNHIGNSRFVFAEISEGGVYLVGTNFEKFETNTNSYNEFSFPCDKVVGLPCGGESQKVFRNTMVNIRSINSSSFHTSSSVTWSLANCNKLFGVFKIHEIDRLYSLLVGIVTPTYMVKEGFRVERLVDKKTVGVRVRFVNGELQLLDHSKKLPSCSFLFSGTNFSTIVVTEKSVDPPLIAPTPLFEIFKDEIWSSTAKLSHPRKGYQNLVFMKSFRDGGSTILVEFGKLEVSVKSIKGFITQKYLRSFGGVSYSLDFPGTEFRFENRAYWLFNKHYVYNTVTRKYLAKTFNGETPEIERLRKVYDTEFVGKLCEINQESGHLVSGFQWRSLDGVKMERVILSIENNIHSISGCVIKT